MSSLIKILFMAILFSFFSCEKEENIMKVYNCIIPNEDKCEFNIGDTLLYNCDDGTIDTVIIKNVEITTKRVTNSPNLFGNASVSYIDYQTITIKTFNNNWRDMLNSVINSPINDSICYRVSANANCSGRDPHSKIINGCDNHLNRVIADSEVIFDDKLLNFKYYTKVYYYKHNSYSFYWNLKYGIIRFTITIDGTTKVWDLEK